MAGRLLKELGNKLDLDTELEELQRLLISKRKCWDKQLTAAKVLNRFSWLLEASPCGSPSQGVSGMCHPDAVLGRPTAAPPRCTPADTGAAEQSIGGGRESCAVWCQRWLQVSSWLEQAERSGQQRRVAQQGRLLSARRSRSTRPPRSKSSVAAHARWQGCSHQHTSQAG